MKHFNNFAPAAVSETEKKENTTQKGKGPIGSVASNLDFDFIVFHIG